MDKEVQYHCYNNHLKVRKLVVRAHDILKCISQVKPRGEFFITLLQRSRIRGKIMFRHLKLVSLANDHAEAEF